MINRTLEDNIIVDFSKFPFCFRTTSIKEFTNKLKNEKQFFENFQCLIEKNIPYFGKYNFNTISNATQGHSHAILPSDPKHELIKKIVKNICKEYYKYSDKDFELFYDNNINEYSIWQLGVSGGIRLIGIRYLNIFYVLFIDYHHLIYSSPKYNQDNCKKYDFCPITYYMKGK